MPATLKSLTSKTNQKTVLIDPDDPDSTVTFRYRTKAFTANMMQAMNNAGSDAGAAITGFLAVVTEWDFVPDAGEPPVPLTEQALGDIPFEIMVTILEAITDDQSPKEATTT